jgi:4-diphosphocytidyl-2-C-methyl-D-erythritol kinase
LAELAAAPLEALAGALHNDLEPATLSLRPELAEVLERLRSAGALGARISGSGPTAFGLFGDLAAAQEAAARFEGALVAQT